MGGQAFTSGPNPLNIVRLSTTQYARLRNHYRSQLLEYYVHAIVPPEAPEKTDHGDIDILVDKQRYDFTTQNLAETFGAKRSKQEGATTSFAIPLPDTSISDKYFQLDVHLCRKSFFAWETMLYSYGDLWHILSATVARSGFAISHQGFSVGVKEIEATHPKDSLLV